MRVLFASARPCYPLFLGGAEISMHETLLMFRQQGHQCLALGQVTYGMDQLRDWMATHTSQVRTAYKSVLGTKDGVLERWEVRLDVGYPVLLNLHSTFLECLRRQFAEFRPDLVFSQLDGSELVIHEAMRQGVRICHTIRDVDNLHNFLPYWTPRPANADFVTLVTSEYTQAEVAERYGISSHVVPPPIHCERYCCHPPENGFVLMVNPVPSKGREIVHHLIEHLTEFSFVLVEGWRRLHEADWPFPNVQLVEKRYDIEHILAGAAVLLVPSQALESFGRIVVEGQAAGVPVLASRHSGLIEAHGDGDGMVGDYQNPRAWESILRQLMNDPPRQQAMREHGWKNCMRFTREHHWQRLEEVLSL